MFKCSNVKCQMSNIKCQILFRLNFCWSVTPHFFSLGTMCGSQPPLCSIIPLSLLSWTLCQKRKLCWMQMSFHRTKKLFYQKYTKIVNSLHLNKEAPEAKHQECTIVSHEVFHGGWPLQPQDIILSYPNLNIIYS